MNFYQDSDTLYIIGGYGFSSTANDHITFPNLTSVLVSDVIDAVISETSFVPYIKQIFDALFAVTGGQLGKINHTFYLMVSEIIASSSGHVSSILFRTTSRNI